MDKPEALRLAEFCDGNVLYQPAAAELRRLHAENERLAAALASSCDEQRHELWESGGVAGCERARVAERQRDALQEANEAFGKRQEWWNEKMLTLEAQRGALLEQRDELRRALEIIAVGDATNPQAQAAEELIALGYWRDIPEARAAIKAVEGEKT